MESVPEKFPPLATYGIGLSVSSEGENSVLELNGNAGQLIILRQIIDICQCDFNIQIEKESDVPELAFEAIPTDLPLSKPLKIAVVGAFDINKPCLVDCYVKENFRGNLLKENLHAEIVRHKFQKNNRKINVEIREINTHNFPWDQNSDYCNSVDVIVLSVNATAKMGVSDAQLGERLVEVIQNFPFPDVPMILVGIRLEGGKLLREKKIETFAESLGIPYVEYFINRSMAITPIFSMAVDMAMHQKMPLYRFRVVCKKVKPEFFVNHEFYQKLHQKIADLIVVSPLNYVSFDHRLDVYRCINQRLKERHAYLALLNFNLAHFKSKVGVLQKEARTYLLQLEKSSWGRTIVEALKQELAQGSGETRNIVKTLKVLRHIINIGMYSLTLVVKLNTVDALCEFLQDNESLVNLKLVFKDEVTAENLNKLGNALQSCGSLRYLKFLSQEYMRIKQYSGFQKVFESHPSLSSLDLSHFGLNQDNITEILKWVSRNPLLLTLNLSLNYFSGEAVQALKYLLQKNSQLAQLRISNGRLGYSDLSSVLSSAQSPNLLTELDVSRNKLSELGVDYLLRTLANNPQLKNLDVSFCSLSYAAMAVLLRGLQKLDTLASLNLAGNLSQNNQEWLVKILALLQLTVRLKKINLSQNPLLDDGAQLISGFLRHNRSLESIDISQTKMTDMGLIALSDALHVNASLQTLVMKKNSYTSVGISTLLFALSRNRGLFSLDIGESVECKETLGSLIGLIPDNTRIRELGFMPSREKRTVELVALYENAFLGNSLMTSMHDDFNCRCGRCLCVNANQIISGVEDNRLNRYKNLALLIKAYFNSAEDHVAMLVFKRIPKDVILAIFKKAYPELPPKVFGLVNQSLFFKPNKTGEAFRKEKSRKKLDFFPIVPISPVKLNSLGVEVSLTQEAEDVVLTISSETRDYQTLCRMAEICREKIHLIMPYNKYEIEVEGVEQKKAVLVGDDSEEDLYFRVAIMGEVASGKTIFANRFVHDIYQNNFKATIGVDFKEKSIMFGKTRCKLQIFDFAGTRERDSVTHVFLRDIDGILLTVDLSRPQGYEETYERIVCESSFPNMPVVMVGLKSDISSPESVQKFRLTAEKLNLPCMVASSKTRQNINLVFDLLLNMIMTQKTPGYVAKLRIRKITLDWFTLPRFYGDLNQLFLEDAVLCQPLVEHNFKYASYLGVLQWLHERKDPKAICRFYIKNLDSDDKLIRTHAVKNIDQIQAESPECLNNIVQLFYQELTYEKNSHIRNQAVHGLRILGKLDTQRVKNICLRVFENIQFSASYALTEIIKKIKEYDRSDLIRDCLGALSGVHASCFSILREMGANQACDHIEKRVLQELDVYLKRLQNPPVDLSHSKFGLSKK